MVPNAVLEAFVGGTIGLVHEGDSVTIDAIKLLIQLNVDEAEIAKRRAAWKTPEPRYLHASAVTDCQNDMLCALVAFGGEYKNDT